MTAGDYQLLTTVGLTLGTVKLDAHSAGQEVYVLVADHTGRCIMLTQMNALGNNRWQITLRLIPGLYRYRFYVRSDRTITYLSPADAARHPIRMSGFDAMVRVPPVLRRSASAAFDGDSAFGAPRARVECLSEVRERREPC
jgi:hypothetical protein